ncbi:MAG TPA: protein kinase, partial [Kofleriaceae bacterium]
IQHAGIVKIFDVGMHAGRAYLIMEYLEGETLAQRIAKGRLPFSQIGDIGRQIATVLDATHSAGVTHRDLKPDNIFLVPDRELGERVKILDFGIAKLSGTLAAASPRTLGTMGTPAYMAPEQWGDTSKVDFRADLYSLGCVAFEMTCGRVPFVASNIAEACGKHLNEKPPAVSSLAPTVPAGLEQLIAKLLAKEPADRPASMRDVARAFAAVDTQALGAAPTLTTDPVSLPLPTQRLAKRSRALPILLGVVALGAGAAAAVYFLQPSSSTPAENDAAVAMIAPEHDAAAATAPQPQAPAPPPVTALPPPPPPPPPPSADAALPIADARTAAKPKSPETTATPSPATGTADAETLQQAVRARSAQTNHCYEVALKDDPTLSGSVTLQIKIDENGRVTSATGDGLTDSLQACLIAQVRDIKFPRPLDPPVSLIIPFRFERE